MSRKGISIRMGLALTALLSAGLLSTCRDFFGTEDLKETIRKEVAQATAEEVVVTLRAANDNMGVPSPYGDQRFKVGIPHTITTTVGKDFAFVRWTVEGGSSDDVVFSNPWSVTTTVTITESVQGLVIRPTFDRRPYPRAWSPYTGSEEVVINASARVTFNEPLDSDSVVLARDGSLQVVSWSLTDENPVETHIEEDLNVSVDGPVVTVSLKAGKVYPVLHTVFLTFSTAVRDVAGNSMADEFTWFFHTGSGVDDRPPVITAFTITNSANETSAADARQIFTNARGVTLNVTAVDQGGGQVYWQHVWQAPSNAAGTTPTAWTSDPHELQYISKYSYRPSQHIDLTGEADTWTKVFVRLEDNVGNVSTPLEIPEFPGNTRLVYYDTVRPTVPVFQSSTSPYVSGGTYYYRAGGVTFTLSSSDAVSGIKGYTTDPAGTSPAPVAQPTLVSSATVYAVDRAGNVSEAGLALAVVEDTTPPTTPDLTGSNSPYVTGGTYYYRTGGVTFTFSSTDTGTGVKGFTTDPAGVSPAPVMSPTLTSSGTVYAVDQVGNVSSVGVPITVVQDNTPPTMPTVVSSTAGYSSGSSYYYTSGGVTFTLSTTETGSGLRGYTTDPAGVSPAPVTNPTLSTSASIYAVDNAGNVSPGRAVTVALDLTPPTTPVVTSSTSPHVSGGTYYYRTGGVAFTLSSTETGSGLRGYSTDPDGVSPAPVMNPTLTSSAALYAFDNIGNVSGGLALTVVQDSTRPSTPSFVGSDSPYVNGGTYYYSSGGVTFTLSSTDSGSGVRGFTTDSAGMSPAPVMNPTLTSSVTVYAADNVGNVSSSGLTLTVVQDNTAPTITGSSLTAGFTSVGGLTTSDTGTGVDPAGYTLTGGSGGSFDGSSLTGLTTPNPNSSTIYLVGARDLAGNTASVTVRHSRDNDNNYTATIE